MKIVGRTFECRKKPIEGSVAEGNASEAPPPIDEEAFEAALAEAGETVEKFYSEELPDLDGMNIAQLKAFAEEKGIDLGSAKLKADIISAIIAAISAAEASEME